MLSTLRSSVSGILAKGLLAFLVLTFAVWGVGDMVRGGGGNWLVKVGDESITYTEFARNKAYLERSLQAMGMVNIDSRALEDDLLRRMIEEKLVRIRMHELNLEVSEPMLAERIRSAPMFQDEKGKFSREAFAAMLYQRQMNEAGFLEQLKADILATVLLTSVSVEGVTLPEGYATLLAANEAQTRDVVLVNIPADTKAKISEEDIDAYYEAHKELLYMQPERRSLEYASFNASQLRALVDAQITEAALRERYESDKERFKNFEEAKPILREELRSEHQDTVTEDVAIAIEDALAGGDNLTQAMEKAGIKAQMKTLKAMAADDGSSKTERAAIARGFTLQEGETSSLETTEDGTYYVVALSEVTPATPKPLENVRGAVRAQLAKEGQRSAVRKRASEAKTALEKNSDWRAVLAEEGLSGQLVRNVARPEKSKNDAVPALLQQAIFEHGTGDVAGPLTQENGNTTLALITAVHQPQVKPKKVDSKTVEALNKEILMQYFTYLSTHHPVRVNEALLTQMRQSPTE